MAESDTGEEAKEAEAVADARALASSDVCVAGAPIPSTGSGPALTFPTATGERTLARGVPSADRSLTDATHVQAQWRSSYHVEVSMWLRLKGVVAEI